MYNTLIFDMDGTLLNSLDDIAQAGNYALGILGFPPHPVQAYRHMVGSGISVLIERMLPPEARKPGTVQLALSLYEKHYNAHMNDNTRPYPGIVQMLAQLKERGIKLGVLSNKSHEFTQPIAEQQFPGVFDMVMGLQEGFAQKPDPGSLLHIMHTLDAGQTLYCGDSDVDMKTALAAGVEGCGVLWGFRDEAELRAAGARHLVQTAEQLTALALGAEDIHI